MEYERPPVPADRARAGGYKFMWLCCVAMLLPAAVYLVTVRMGANLAEMAVTVAPLAVCLGVHLVLHRLMGSSCHAGRAQNRTDREQGGTYTSSRGRVGAVAPAD